MAAEISIKALIARMEKVIQYNESLFDRQKKGLKGDTIIKKIIKGLPDKLPTEYPCILLIPGNPLRDKQYFGSNAYYNKIRIVARVLVSSYDEINMQAAMLDIEELLLETFEDNTKLTDPADSTDTTGLVKLTRGERTTALAGLIIKQTGALIDGLDVSFLLEQTNN